MPNSNPDIHRQQAREWYQRNKESVLEKKRNFSPEKKEKERTIKAKYRVENAEKIRLKNMKPARRLSNAKSIAKRRGIGWFLELEQYSEIIKNPCYYCNNKLAPPVEQGSGLDRLDSNKDYSANNVVSCCFTCNTIKHDLLTPEETMVMVNALLNYRQNQHTVSI